MEEDSIHESESLVSPRNLELRGAFRGEDDGGGETGGKEKETRNRGEEVRREKYGKTESNEVEDEKNGGKSDVKSNDGTDRGEGLMDHLLNSLPVSIAGKPKGDSEPDGLNDQLLPGLPALVTEDVAPASDEATLLISTIIHE